MDRFVNHDELMESLGAFALDAVGPEEAETIRRHLEECPRCAEEVAQHHQVAALMGNAGGDAPAHLWEEIAGKIGEVSRADGPRTVLTPMPSTGSRRPPSSVVVRARKLAGLGARRGVVLGAAAAVVVIALLSWQVARLNDRVGSSAEANASGVTHLAEAALANPDAQKVDLTTETTTRATEAEVVVLPSGQAYLVNEGLPALPPDQTYQLWGRAAAQLISLGVLGNRPTSAAFSVGPSAKYTAYVVTAERAGGVVTTTHRPIATSGPLRT